MLAGAVLVQTSISPRVFTTPGNPSQNVCGVIVILVIIGFL